MPRDHRLFAKLRILCALLPLPMLGGCFAAAALAVPAMTGMGIVTRKGDKEGPPPAPASAQPVVAEQAVSPSPPAPQPAVAGTSPAVAAVIVGPDGQTQALTIPAAALPAPVAARLQGEAGAPWDAFFSYALEQGGLPTGKDAKMSALLAPGSAAELLPRRRECNGGDNAVIIDLDPAGGRFAAGAGWRAPPGMVTQLEELRRAGIVVMWISDLDTSQLDEIAAALMASGLDPAGKDPILLAIGDGDRKQTLRQQAGQNACVVAIAGDERKDFDELFTYLRDPKAAANFDSMIGAGWFLVPDSLSAPAVSASAAG